MVKQVELQNKKRKIHLYNDEEWTTFGLIYDIFFFIIITLSITTLFFDYTSFEKHGEAANRPFIVGLNKYDYIFTIIFILDFILRLGVYSYNTSLNKKLSIKDYPKFFMKKDTIFGILAIVPIFFPKFVWNIFRILKYFTLDEITYFLKRTPGIGEIILGFGFLMGAFKKELKQLVTVTIIFLIIIFAFSLVIFNISLENPNAFSVNADESMDTIGDAFWFTFVTITTIGYGDIVPVGTVARIVSMALSLVGIGFLAIYTAVIVDGFSRYYNETKGSKRPTRKTKKKSKKELPEIKDFLDE